MRARGEAGFTLPELLMAVAILALIIAPLSLSFITGLRVIGKVDQKFTDSCSARISAADFAGDVDNATVITTGNNPAQCGSGGTRLVTFGWNNALNNDLSQVSTITSKVTYYYDSTNKKLIRRICKNGAPASSSTAAVSLNAAPVVSCFKPAVVAAVACDTAANPTIRWAKMQITSAANSKTPDTPTPTPFSFQLAGTRRAR